MIKLSNRLKLLSDHIIGSKTICDVGCDHGKLSIYAILECSVDFAYLLDVNQEPLNTAKNNFAKYNLTDKAEFFLSNGLRNFDKEFDCLVISGMGGQLIKTILEQDLAKVRKTNKIILQPNSDFALLRYFLYKNDFEIIDDNMILDNSKFCYYLVVKNGRASYSNEDIKFSTNLRKTNNLVYKEYWDKRVKTLENEIKNIKDENTKNEVKKRIKEIKDKILN